MSKYHVRVGEDEHRVTVRADGSVLLDGNACSAEITRIDESTFSVVRNGASFLICVARSGGSYEALCNGVLCEVTVESERARLLREYAATSGTLHHRYEVHAPMPALVVRVEVTVGDEVQAGQGLVVLEAMKMENELKAHHAGKVKEIRVHKGKTVEKGELLLLLE